MEKETKPDSQPKEESGGLGRAFIAIGLIIVLLGVVFTSWWIGGFGAILVAIGFAAGGSVQT